MAGREKKATESSNGFLSAEAILGAEDSRFAEVEVPEWGGRVRLRTLTGAEGGALEVLINRTSKEGGAPDLAERIVAACACNAAGERIFSDKQVKALGQKNRAALQKVADAALKLNAMSEGEVSVMEGNSGPTAIAVAGSD